MIFFCKCILFVNVLVLAFIGVLCVFDLDVSGGKPLDYLAYVAAWYAILVIPVSSLFAGRYLSVKKAWQTLPGANTKVGGKHLRLALSCVLLLVVVGIHIATIKIDKEGKVKADKGESLLNDLEKKVKERKKAGEQIQPEEYEVIGRECEALIRQYPPYYHTLNRIRNLYAIEFILTFLALGLPLAKSIKN
jgi:hypothetical protein